MCDKIAGALKRLESKDQRSPPPLPTNADAELVANLRGIALNEYPTLTDRINATKFVVMYYTLKSFTVESEDEYKKVASAQTKDLPMLWALIDVDESSLATSKLDDRRTIDQLQLDLATRMRDRSKLVAVYERFVKPGIKSLEPEELFLAFTVSPMIGRWRDFRQLGGIISSMQGGLSTFHEVAMQRPDMPDYEVLYKQAEKMEDTPIEKLEWKAYEVKSFNLWLDKIEGGEPEDRKGLEEGFAEAGDEGKDVLSVLPPEEMPKLFQQGGFVRSLSVTTPLLFEAMLPLPLVGQMDSQKISIEGYLKLQIPAQYLGPGNQAQSTNYREELTLKLDEEEGKKRTYTGTLRSETNVNGETMNANFKAKIVLEETSLDYL